MRQKEEEFEKMMEEVREDMKRNFILFGAIILLTITFFGKVSGGNTELKEFVLFDEKTNNVYTTDEKTYREWEKCPYHKDYPFKDDPRFHKKSRQYVRDHFPMSR